MGQRLQLQALLKELGPEKVYFQEPSADVMVYPCIVYAIDSEDVTYADNNPYNLTLGYQATVIDRNPDSLIPGKLARLPMSKFQRAFRANGLHHTVYKIFF